MTRKVIVLRDGSVPHYLVIEPDEDDDNLWHLVKWAFTLGEAQEIQAGRE